MLRKRNKNVSLSEKLSTLIHTKPLVGESDDEDLTTIDKIGVAEEESSADELEIPKYRKVNNRFLDEDDNKYSGRGVSRNDIDDFVESDLEEDSDTEIQESNQNNSSEAEDESEGKEISSGNESDSHKKGINASKIDINVQDDNFNSKIFFKAYSDIEKGKGIKNQLHLWDFLLDCRMKFQKCLLASNQFATFQNLPKFISTGGFEFQTSVSQTRRALRTLLCSLLTLQDTLLNSNEEYLSTTSNERENKKQSGGGDYDYDNDDEEIESDTDPETIEKVTKNQKTSNIKIKNINAFSEEISKRHKVFETYRNNTIQKWNDKTKITHLNNKNFSAFEQSTLKQIQHVLLDKQRLIKRTQTKRSHYHILGENDEPINKSLKVDEENIADTLSDTKVNITHKEIFDDDAFYYVLLSELVKRKANDITDPVQLGRQWMQLQKIRSKMKKTVDMKASKGRKVRFVVHPKLVNFMMSVDDPIYNEESRKELLNSLFGKNKK